MIFIHVIWALNHGGAERFLINVAKDRALNSSHVVCCIKRGAIIEPEGVDVVYGMQALVFVLRHCLSKSNVVFISWMYRAGLIFFPLALLAKIFPENRTFFFIRHTPPFSDVSRKERINLFIYNFSKNFYNKIIFNSRQSMLRHEGINQETNSCKVLYNYGYERSSIETHELLRQLNTQKVVLFSCRHHHMKGFDFFTSLVMKYKNNTEVGFIVVGDDSKKEREKGLFRLTGQLGKGRIAYSYNNEELSSLIPYVDVVLSTSLYGESFPNLGLDASVFGIDFVCSDVGDSSLLTSNNMVFQAGDVDGAYDALNTALYSQTSNSNGLYFNRELFESKLKEIIEQP